MPLHIRSQSLTRGSNVNVKLAHAMIVYIATTCPHDQTRIALTEVAKLLEQPDVPVVYSTPELRKAFKEEQGTLFSQALYSDKEAGLLPPLTMDRFKSRDEYYAYKVSRVRPATAERYKIIVDYARANPNLKPSEIAEALKINSGRVFDALKWAELTGYETKESYTITD